MMASDMQNSPDCLPGSPLPAEEQLIMPSHPSCTHGGFHTLKGLMGRPARSDSCHYRLILQEIDFHCWFSASADGPPEPCWYCLRTQESGSRPETGQQVVVFLFSFLPSNFRGNDFRVFYSQLCCEETEIAVNCIVLSTKSISHNKKPVQFSKHLVSCCFIMLHAA